VSDGKGESLSKKRLTLYDKAPQPSKQRTYCNPLNIDYGYTPIPNFTEWGKHRAQYKIYHSADGKKWKLLIDKSNNKTDVPHDYVELEDSVQTRFIKLENIHMPGGKFAISGLRVFGNGNGPKPDTVKQFIVLRTEKDKRSAWIKWSPVDNAYAYNIYMGIAPDKLYNCIMVHSNNEYYCKSMDREKPYYFCIEAINENGVSARSKMIKVE
jgi:hypothetical protein